VRLAWFYGDCEEAETPNGLPLGLCMDDIMKLAGTDLAPELSIVLVPDDADLTRLTGDDWDDAPANANAGPPYEERLPDGARWIRVRLGDRWPL
jgi:hypothetical protein